MNAEEIIAFISNAEKKTPVKVYVRQSAPIDYGSAKVFGSGDCRVVFGDWKELQPILAANAEKSRTWWWKTTGAIPPCPCWT